MRPRVVVIGVVAATLVGLGAWLLGGFRSAERVRAVRAGGEVDQTLFRTRLLEARAGWVQESKYVQRRHVLLLVASVTNLSRQTQLLRGPATDHNFPHSLFPQWPRGGKVAVFSQAKAYQGNISTWQLQPRLPARVVLEYDLPAGMAAPARLTVGLAGFAYTASGILDPRGYWEFQATGFRAVRQRDPVSGRMRTTTQIVPRIVARVTLPVTEAA